MSLNSDVKTSKGSTCLKEERVLMRCVGVILLTEGQFVLISLNLPTSHILVFDGSVGTLTGLL